MCAVGCWLGAGNTADQIGDLVIEVIRKDVICTFGNGITNDARFRNARQASGLAEACFNSGTKANAFHERRCITLGDHL